MNPSRNHEVAGSIPGLPQLVDISSGVGRRCGLDLAWLWHGAAAVALIRPLALEPPHAMGTVLKSKK